MANIQARTRKNGENSFTVRIRIKNEKPLVLTFHDLSDAEMWVDENERKYKEDPDKYHEWLHKKRKNQHKFPINPFE